MIIGQIIPGIWLIGFVWHWRSRIWSTAVSSHKTCPEGGQPCGFCLILAGVFVGTFLNLFWFVGDARKVGLWLIGDRDPYVLLLKIFMPKGERRNLERQQLRQRISELEKEVLDK